MNTSLNFQSHACYLSEKPKNVQNFLALSDYKGTTTHGNICRVHLPTPHTGPVILHQRATKYHPSTIATHVTDFRDMLKE